MRGSAPKKPTTVLIVENEGIVRLELTAQFMEMGLVVLSADNADEAIALLDAHAEIRLLFTDIKMPGSMDGVRLAAHVRHRWPPVKIIVASGFAGTQLSDLPDDAIFLCKPYGPGAIAGALKAHRIIIRNPEPSDDRPRLSA
jgi:CheY-like chemotaxis protein